MSSSQISKYWRLPNPSIRHVRKFKTYGMINITEKLWKALRQMENLISLEIVPGSCAAFQTARLKAIPSTAASKEYFESLARAGELRHLVLGEGMCYKIFTSIPPFRNLRTLVLHGLPGSLNAEYDDELVEVLISSPQLRSLGLSIGVPHSSDASSKNITKLYSLATKYEELCYEGNRSKLELENLELGYGYLPVDLSEEKSANQIHDLSEFTNLLRLKSLKILSNTPEILGTGDIDFSVFRPATNLQYISADFMSPRFLEFMSQHQQIQTRENSAIKHLWRGIALGHTLNPDPSQEPSTTDNLWNPTVDELITHCPDLLELETRIKPKNLSLLQSKIIPNIKKLHTLFLSQIELRDLDLVSQESGKRVETSSDEYREAYILEKQNFSWKPRSPASILQPSTDRHAERARLAIEQSVVGGDLRSSSVQHPPNTLTEKAKQTVAQDAEAALKCFIEKIFHLHWQINSALPNNYLPPSQGLQYLCVGSRVYSWVQQENGEFWGRKVVKLDLEDVVGFLGGRKVGVPVFQRKFESRIWEERRERG